MPKPYPVHSKIRLAAVKTLQQRQMLMRSLQDAPVSGQAVRIEQKHDYAGDRALLIVHLARRVLLLHSNESIGFILEMAC